MYFVDFEKLKFNRTGNYRTKELYLSLEPSDTIKTVKEKTREGFDYFIEEANIETLFNIVLDPFEVNDDESAEIFFTTAVNVISALFLDAICLKEPRARERRLDVPEKLKELAGSLSLIKRLVNMKSSYDRFNLTIEWVAIINEKEVEYNFTLVPQGDNHDN